MSDIQKQLTEARQLEENLKSDLKRISKDIDVLQRRDIEVRNEISSKNKKFHHQESVQQRKIQESKEKLQNFLAELKIRVKDRAKSKETEKGKFLEKNYAYEIFFNPNNSVNPVFYFHSDNQGV